MSMRAIYFGVFPRDSGGHFCWSIGGGSHWLDADSNRNLVRCPFGAKELDGAQAPKDRSQGSARLTRIQVDDGWWTILAWHDYTGDKRPGSNSALAIHGAVKYGFVDMMQLGRELFPEVFQRLDAAAVILWLTEPVVQKPIECVDDRPMPADEPSPNRTEDGT